MSVRREEGELGFAERLLLLLTVGEGRLRPLRGCATEYALAAVSLLELEEMGVLELDDYNIVTPRRFDIGNFSSDKNLRDIHGEVLMRGSMELRDWLTWVAARADGMLLATVGRLERLGLLSREEERKFLVIRKNYLAATGREGIELRRSLMDILLSENEPPCRAIRFICLADALGLFRILLTDEERSPVKDRIVAVRRMDEVGYRLALALEDLAPVMYEE